jgi:hypothetical protein
MKTYEDFWPRYQMEMCDKLQWIGGWVGSRVRVDDVEKKKSFTARNRSQVVQSVARRYTN